MSFDDLPRSPSGRIPQWVIDEAQGRAATPTPWRADAYDTSAEAAAQAASRAGRHAGPAGLPRNIVGDQDWQYVHPGARPPRGRRTLRVRRARWAVGVLCGLLGAAWVGVWVQQLPELSWDAVMAELSRKPVRLADLEATGTLLPPEAVPGGGGFGGPEPGHEEADVPLGAPAPVDWDGAPYAFLSTQARPDGLEVPVTWSPCRPVHYVVNTAGAPVGFADDVATVVAELADATGFVFVDDGPTDESAGPDRPIYQPERYGRRWAPLLVQFSDETLQSGLEGDVVGQGGPRTVRREDGLLVAVSGTVWLDASLLERQPVDAEPAHVGVLRHELAHALGLDHVEDRTQLMNPETRGEFTTFQSGDLYGLSQLARGVCAPDL
ncbi:matrixin family metalloprotease [Cellulomonas sp. A375-1]|uniref:matrixin family metalloprotease n=1 Tax=Cellulomonas sp. A375-1 TaxID=1672219 RepID=UPI00069D163E|nr:matrixin family metalloprotease [Cellulomonas sp. A375-1]